MTHDELRLRRLAAQHLLAPSDTRTVVKDLCGVQAQYLSHALCGLSIRCRDADTRGLVKSWTNRGTMHLFSEDDLPLFLHEGRTHFLRPQDTLESDGVMSAGRKGYFAELILDGVDNGMDTREEMKTLCRQKGMTEEEMVSAFDPWGGLLRALCEAGKLCCKVQQEKAYMRCPDFEPMGYEEAWLEKARRYFTAFGPATVQDAAYFFGVPQRQVGSWLPKLPLREMQVDGKLYYWIQGPEHDGGIPDCLFLAGFDQLMLGYEKKTSLFLPFDHIRDIFTPAGIVRPALLVNGRVEGFWNLKNKKLRIHLFSGCDKAVITEQAEEVWPDLNRVEFT